MPTSPSPSRKKLTSWMAADHVAHAAAKRLLQARLAHLHGHGQAPDPKAEEEVDRLRRDASRLYQEALEEFETQSAQSGQAGR